MICPNCNKEMKDKGFWGYPISLSIEPDYPEWTEKYYCKNCKITYEDGQWNVPKLLLPTDKQKNVILFINSRLETDYQAITKHQCWDIIRGNFDKAKNTNYGIE